MAKTLLQYVQDCLESMVSDQVSSITDSTVTEEALVVANIAKQTYEFMHSQFDWPYEKKLTTLEGLSDLATPNYLKIPDDISEVLWFKYNGKKKTYQDPETFLENSDSAKVIFDNGDITYSKVDDLNGVSLYIKNNQDATHYTSFDNKHLVFDAYDVATEDTMHQANTSVYAVVSNPFTLSDSFIPFLPKNMEPLFQAEVNAAAHLTLRQQASAVDEKRALKGRSRQQTKIDKVNKTVRTGFGRK